MGKSVKELQIDIINNRLDVVSILRKAHLIASKLDLTDFDKWITNELNGYDDSATIPKYRRIVGEIKAKNPYNGLIPVMLSSEIASELNVRMIDSSMSEIASLARDNSTISITLPTELSETLCASEGITFPCYFICDSHYFKGIIDSVKNTLLEWCIKLEKDGILGEEFDFSNQEVEKAKEVPQQINYYGQVINGDVNNSQVVSGDSNSLDVTFHCYSTLVDEIRSSLKSEQIDEDKKNEALEIVSDIDDSIKQEKRPSFIKSAFTGLKDFLIAEGASINASIISSKISGI